MVTHGKKCWRHCTSILVYRYIETAWRRRSLVKNSMRASSFGYLYLVVFDLMQYERLGSPFLLFIHPSYCSIADTLLANSPCIVTEDEANSSPLDRSHSIAISLMCLCSIRSIQWGGVAVNGLGNLFVVFCNGRSLLDDIVQPSSETMAADTCFPKSDIWKLPRIFTKAVIRLLMVSMRYILNEVEGLQSNLLGILIPPPKSLNGFDVRQNPHIR